jgi:hypothetical protein
MSDQMDNRRLHILVEGQTEEILVRDLFAPHLERHGWWVFFSVQRTKRVAGGRDHRGGVTSWSKIEREIRRLLDDRGLTVTTLFDYYGFPDDAPGMADRPASGAVKRVEHVEAAMAELIGDRRFRPNLVLHETEAWVFAAAAELGELRDNPDLVVRLRADCAEAGGPELVNSTRERAPSKRLLTYLANYGKLIDGPLAICELGLAELRAVCPHLDAWLLELER